MTALTTTEILAVCSDVSTAKIVDLRKWADELGVAKNGSKFDIATRIVARIQPREAAAKDDKPETAVKAPRKVRMQVVRADDTTKVTTWATEDNARAFAVKALAEGDYKSASIEVGDEWIPVVAD